MKKKFSYQGVIVVLIGFLLMAFYFIILQQTVVKTAEQENTISK